MAGGEDGVGEEEAKEKVEEESDEEQGTGTRRGGEGERGRRCRMLDGGKCGGGGKRKR